VVDLSEWIRGINLLGKRLWLQPTSKSAVVVAGVVVNGTINWIEANTRTGAITIPARLYGDPKKFKAAHRQFQIVAEQQLEKFVTAARRNGESTAKVLDFGARKQI
jgi:NAD(P)H-dependent flavin oxidoreductase YrpB (nitropropane dioxygenase family)